MIPAHMPLPACERQDAAWPLTTYLELGAMPTAVPCFRLHARAVAMEWQLPGLAEPAELLVSELTTNAIQASGRLRTRQTPVVRLCMVSDRALLVIHVWDGSDEMPVRQNARPDEIGGRGLLLVETLGKDWGAYREAHGKVVWVLISPSGDP
jgi:anti-sigma regulatory factor (Ser/Thr protein kinase)